MKKLILFVLLPFFVSYEIIAQEIPGFRVIDLKDQVFETSSLNNADNTIKVLSFWATWCIPCINELSIINDLSGDWKKDLKFDFYAISQDDSRSSKKVASFVNGKGWDFNVLLDKNQDFKRRMNLPGVPYTIIVKNGKIIYRHIGYTEGDENVLYKMIKDNQ